MEAIEELLQLSDSMRQGQAILADEDVDENSTASSCRSSTFLNVVALGNVILFGVLYIINLGIHLYIYVKTDVHLSK
ncbi:dynamin-2A-like isoform X3 [Rosa rugosa]|uniref:dynamin-2A-like isoform X3 n=1 Tax=Rosa rugosa TaxID=74645 RepID=UPI002B40F7F5|nr:dynamin-2A-like isoform X3 [Rosa rugosa]